MDIADDIETGTAPPPPTSPGRLSLNKGSVENQAEDERREKERVSGCSLRAVNSSCVSVRALARACARACVCVCVRAHICVRVFVCVRARVTRKPLQLTELKAKITPKRFDCHTRVPTDTHTQTHAHARSVKLECLLPRRLLPPKPKTRRDADRYVASCTSRIDVLHRTPTNAHTMHPHSLRKNDGVQA